MHAEEVTAMLSVLAVYNRHSNLRLVSANTQNYWSVNSPIDTIYSTVFCTNMMNVK